MQPRQLHIKLQLTALRYRCPHGQIYTTVQADAHHGASLTAWRWYAAELWLQKATILLASRFLLTASPISYAHIFIAEGIFLYKSFQGKRRFMISLRVYIQRQISLLHWAQADVIIILYCIFTLLLSPDISLTYNTFYRLMIFLTILEVIRLHSVSLHWYIYTYYLPTSTFFA